jgi:hypothetical protein
LMVGSGSASGAGGDTPWPLMSLPEFESDTELVSTFTEL